VARHLCPRDDVQPDPDTERMFFTHANGGKIDAMREQIRAWEQAGVLTEDERVVLLAALVYAVSYTSNTSGVFKGFHRGWGGQTGTALYRILSAITLRPPVLHDNDQDNRAYQLDAQALAERLRDGDEAVAVAYLDPPYNQHPYGSNYHVLNTVVLWDQPRLPPQITARTKSAIRTDWRTDRRSAYNYATALAAYDCLLQTIQARYILTSYSTDGNMPLAEMLDCAARRGALSVVTRPYKRYRVSSQRMSRKPINAEFVLSVDTQCPAQRGEVARVLEAIRETEAAALSAHQERRVSVDLT
jgi:adenine-specific DNA-methyltransferase